MATELNDLSMTEIYELQKSLLTTSTLNNPYLKPNPINPDLSRGLNTNSKTIIGAINEIFSITNSIKKANAAFIERFNNIIGDEKLNPNLIERLSELGSNFYEALFNTWDKASDNSGGTSDDEKIEQFQNQLDELREQIESIIENGTGGGSSSNSKMFNTYEDKRFTGKNFTISSLPISTDAAAVYINGVHYDRDCFEIASDRKTFTWVADDFEIICNYKLATEFDCLKKYYTKSNDTYALYDGELTRDVFINGEFYEIDEDNSDKIIVRYNSYGINNTTYYRGIYDISLLNTAGKGIVRDEENSEIYTNDYNWNGISPVLNKNLVGDFDYTDNGNVRIKLDSRATSNFVVVSEKNWENYKSAIDVLYPNDSIDTFEDFCRLVKDDTDINWVSFFAFEIGENNYTKIYMINDKTDPITLADNPADGEWFYDWDYEQSKPLAMADMSSNPYIDLTAIFGKLQEVYNEN